MGSGWLINYLTNRNRRTALQKELRQKRIALEKIRKICVDEIEKILKSRNNRAIKVASRQIIKDDQLGTQLGVLEAQAQGEQAPTGETDDNFDALKEGLKILVAILCYASYNGIIPNENISSSIDICNRIKCLNDNSVYVTIEDIIPCIPDTVTTALSSAEIEITEDIIDNVPIGERVRKRQPISSLKKQLKLATYKLENIRNYCKKILIESVPKERNSRFGPAVIAVADIAGIAAIVCTAANPSYDTTQVETCTEDLTNCISNSTSNTSAEKECFSEYA